MTNELENDVLGGEVTDNPILAADIGELRKFCSMFGIPASKSWKKEDYVKALTERMKQVELINAANEKVLANQPAKGHTRIVVHKDPSPTASNRSIFISVNGRMFQIPRGLEVDVPNPIVEVLANSTTTTTVQTNSGAKNMAEEKYEVVTATAYPYSIIARSEGDFENPNDQRKITYALREKFVNKYGKWPTAAELSSAITSGAISRD